MKFIRFIAKTLFFVGFLSIFADQLVAESQFILFRHAEKQKDGTSNPELTKKGEARAQRIAQLLENTAIDGLFSTDYKRTLSTIQPLSESKGLTIELYDPRDLAKFAKGLKAKVGTYVIAGHSNTTPQLASLLAQQEVPEMDESQYSDIFVITVIDGKSHLQKLSSD